jgi:hypothetical protein
MSARHEVYQPVITATGASADFAHDCRKIRVSTTVYAGFRVAEKGINTAADATNSAILTPGCVDYVTVNPGQHLQVYMSGAGFFSVTELSS